MGKQKPKYEVAWVCNGYNPKCRGKIGCYYRVSNGVRGACMHTLDPLYAKYGALDPKKHRERFEKFSYKDQIRYYEREVSS